MSVRAELFSIRGLNPGTSDRTPATSAIAQNGHLDRRSGCLPSGRIVLQNSTGFCRWADLLSFVGYGALR
jgi:hypothetical protein